jgi:hypothetical protein
MVFNLLEFNKRFRYYWWLTVNENQRSWGGNQRSWGGPADEIMPWQWLRAEPPEGIVIVDPKDYPKFPPLNRNCDKINIHETILAEYDSVWPREEYLEQYFQVYHSISNQIIRELVKQGLKKAKEASKKDDTEPDNTKQDEAEPDDTEQDDAQPDETEQDEAETDETIYVMMIKSFLPSGLPVDRDGMQKLANTLLETRKKKRIEEEARLEKEKDLMELSRCLICRGIEMVLKRSEKKDKDLNNASSGTTANKKMTKANMTDNGKSSGVKRRRDGVCAERMHSVKLIYYKIQDFM